MTGEKKEMTSEGLKFKTEWRITKFRDPNNKISALAKKGASTQRLIEAYAKNFLGQETIIGNIGLNEGIQAVLNLAFGLASPLNPLFDADEGYIGVGNSAAGESAVHTGLQGVLAYVVFDDTYPSRSNQTVTARSTFAAGVGTGDWNEFTIANGDSDAAVNLNRKVSAKGAKAAGESWIAEVQITVS